MNVLKASSQWIRGTHTTDTTSIDFITITIIYKNNYKHISNRLWSRVCLHAHTHNRRREVGRPWPAAARRQPVMKRSQASAAAATAGAEEDIGNVPASCHTPGATPTCQQVCA